MGRQATGLANGIYLAGTEHSLYAAAVLTGSKRAPAGPWMERGWNARVKLQVTMKSRSTWILWICSWSQNHATLEEQVGRMLIEALACGVPVG